MQDYTVSLLLGIIEGLTEFIPVSSTGHLIIFGEYLTLSSGINDTFSIAIQLGAILAVVFLEHKVFASFLSLKHWVSYQSRMFLIAILPALIMGFLFYDVIKLHLFNKYTVAFSLVVGSILMIIFERLKSYRVTVTSIDQVTYKKALQIGLWQCLALSPGMSRSGATIIGGLACGLDHTTAARFSFIVAVPVMVAAVGYDLLKSSDMLSLYDYQLIGIGFVTSFVVGYIAMVSFIQLLRQWKLLPFAIYRILLAVIVVVFL